MPISDNLLSEPWAGFYDRIKDPGWPEIKTQQDFLNLPQSVIREILFDHFLLEYHDTDVYLDKDIVSYNNVPDVLEKNSDHFHDFRALDFDKIYVADKIQVHYHQELRGGGPFLAKKYCAILNKLYKHKTFENCFEWCAGPGFIGFELLSLGRCQNLYLQDIYFPAIESIKTTIDQNLDLCKNKVFYHHSASISDLPEDWKFDLVIANPPWFNSDLDHMEAKRWGKLPDPQCGVVRRGLDDGWKIHEDFYTHIKKHLTPNGTILLAESMHASGPDHFKSMIEENGLYINDCYWIEYQDPRTYFNKIASWIPKIYFIEVKVKS